MFNFDLRASDFDPTGRRLRVAVGDSPAGETGPVQTVVSPIGLEDALQLDRAGLAALGAAFTAALLPPPLWAAWRESVGRAGEEGLRLRLRVRTADAACAALGAAPRRGAGRLPGPGSGHAHCALPGRAGATGAWPIPALFLRTDDGHLWTPPPPTSRQEETAPGGISIGSIQAQNVVIGDQTVNVTVDQRHSMLSDSSR